MIKTINKLGIVFLMAVVLASCVSTDRGLEGEGTFCIASAIEEDKGNYGEAILYFSVAVQEREISPERFNEEVDRIGASITDKEFTTALNRAIGGMENLQAANSGNQAYVNFYESMKLILEMKL